MLTRSIMLSSRSFMLSCLLIILSRAQDLPTTHSHHRCLDSVSHKNEPGPESDLFSQCTPWKNVSCCTYNISSKANELNLYNFNFNHCPQKKNMSPECRKHFIQDLCFYECSPNIGPWIVKVNQKYRKERIFGVPLCRSECQAWFDACSSDYTCTDNWAKNFIWNNSGNMCHEKAECAKFKDVFISAENFCEKVWDGSWKVVNDSEPCMKMWFDGTKGNPNDEVAKLKMLELSQLQVDLNSSVKLHSYILCIALSVLLSIVSYFH